MKMQPLLMSLLLGLSPHVLADEKEKMQAQKESLKQEILSIEETTRSEQERLEALKRLIEAQREKNQQLDKALEAERLRQQSDDTAEPLKK